MDEKLCVLENMLHVPINLGLAFDVLFIVMAEGEGRVFVSITLAFVVLMCVATIILRIIIKKRKPQLAKESMKQYRKHVWPCLICISITTLIYISVLVCMV